MTAEQLWLFAHEAEVNKDYKLAALYHQQVKEPLFPPVSVPRVRAGSQHTVAAADSSASLVCCVRSREVNVSRVLALNV